MSEFNYKRSENSTLKFRLQEMHKRYDALEAENADLKARLAEVEKERNCYISEWGQYSDLAHDLDCERAALEDEKADLKAKWERVREYIIGAYIPDDHLKDLLEILDEKEGR